MRSQAAVPLAGYNSPSVNDSCVTCHSPLFFLYNTKHSRRFPFLVTRGFRDHTHFLERVRLSYSYATQLECERHECLMRTMRRVVKQWKILSDGKEHGRTAD